MDIITSTEKKTVEEQTFSYKTVDGLEFESYREAAKHELDIFKIDSLYGINYYKVSSKEDLKNLIETYARYIDEGSYAVKLNGEAISDIKRDSKGIPISVKYGSHYTYQYKYDIPNEMPFPTIVTLAWEDYMDEPFRIIVNTVTYALIKENKKLNEIKDFVEKLNLLVEKYK